MRDILDPTDRWLGTPGGALVFGNKAPVAISDALVVLKDSGPVSVAVLGNDYDPEGGALTLMSASAALGTAVVEPDGTVTYTPPLGISGFDTVVYEIADPMDQRRTAQIDITIADPQLSVGTLPDNTLVINDATGTIDITVTAPTAFAGSWQVDTADLLGGPVNLVPPSPVGTVDTGQILTIQPGLWVYDASAGQPARNWQWLRAGNDIAGAIGQNYTVLATDLGQGLSVRETQTDAFGQRSALSAAAGAAFMPADDVALIGWWDADDAVTITATSALVSSWSGKTSAFPDLAQASGSEQPSTGSRVLNGRNVIDFTGAAYMGASLALPVSGDVAFHMALIIDGASNPFEALLSVDAAANDFQIDADDTAQFNGRLNMTGIGASFGLSGGPYSGPVILSAIFDRTASATSSVFVSDVERGNAVYTAPIASSVTLFVMANRALNARAHGAVAELIVTGDVSNRASYHSYLSAKWGLV